MVMSDVILPCSWLNHPKKPQAPPKNFSELIYVPGRRTQLGPIKVPANGPPGEHPAVNHKFLWSSCSGKAANGCCYGCVPGCLTEARTVFALFRAEVWNKASILKRSDECREGNLPGPVEGLLGVKPGWLPSSRWTGGSPHLHWVVTWQKLGLSLNSPSPTTRVCQAAKPQGTNRARGNNAAGFTDGGRPLVRQFPTTVSATSVEIQMSAVKGSQSHNPACPSCHHFILQRVSGVFWEGWRGGTTLKGRAAPCSSA